jgi:hypothetical protein
VAELVLVLIGLLIWAWPVLEETGYTYRGRHRAARPVDVEGIQWPTGADERWATLLHEMAQDSPMREDVRV